MFENVANVKNWKKIKSNEYNKHANSQNSGTQYLLLQKL